MLVAAGPAAVLVARRTVSEATRLVLARKPDSSPVVFAAIHAGPGGILHSNLKSIDAASDRALKVARVRAFVRERRGIASAL